MLQAQDLPHPAEGEAPGRTKRHKALGRNNTSGRNGRNGRNIRNGQIWPWPERGQGANRQQLVSGLAGVFGAHPPAA